VHSISLKKVFISYKQSYNECGTGRADLVLVVDGDIRQGGGTLPESCQMFKHL
jgi:hypothetical protein